MTASTAPSPGSAKFRKYAYVLQMVIALAIIVTGALSIEHQSLARAQNELRVSTANSLGTLRARLEGEINANAQLVRGLVATIALEPDMAPSRFKALASQLFKAKSQLRNIGAAPDLVMRYVYPLEGNEAAIGLNYTKNKAQREAALRAREVGDIVVAGPVNLVQGGQAFISRIPVFIATSGEEAGRFWGLVSAVIDIDRLYRDSGLLNPKLDIELAIRGSDAMGANGEVFFGSADLFKPSSVLVNVILPHGSWQMAAVPKGGWPTQAEDAAQIRTFAAIAALLSLALILFTKRLSDRRLAAEQNAHESDLRFRDFAEASSDWFWEMDDQLRVTYVSERFEEFTGCDPAEVIGKTRLDMVDPQEMDKSEEKLRQHYEDLHAHRPFRNFEYVILPTPGRPQITVSVSGVPIFDKDGNFAGYRGSGEDISERALLEKSKSEFISTVSHELRTPLTSIKGTLNLLDGGAVGEFDEMAQNLIRIALSNADHLNLLVNDILDLEKLQSGSMVFNDEAFDIGQLVRDTVLANEGYSHKYDVEFQTVEPLPLIEVVADRARIMQVLTNLLSNAAKFSPTGDVVKIAVSQDRHHVRVSVRDNGPGVPEHFRAHIFERFTQQDGSDQRQRGGSGLGLNICKTIVERHHGYIDFDTSPNSGSTFYFTLPLRPSAD